MFVLVFVCLCVCMCAFVLSMHTDVYCLSLAGAIDRAEDAYSCATPGLNNGRFCSVANWVDDTVHSMIALTSCVCMCVCLCVCLFLYIYSSLCH